MDEARKARAKVRERERAIWTRVEAVGHEARAANGVAMRAPITIDNEDTATPERVAQSS